MLIEEKDALRDEMMRKIKDKSEDNSLNEYKRQSLSLAKQNEDLIAKTESLLSAKEFLQKELTQMERGHNESVLKIKEINLKYEHQITDLENSLRESQISQYKKEAIIAKITTENEYLCQENFRLKNVKEINDSLLRLPDTCFIDIQSSKKQREAVHAATKVAVDQLAEDKAKEHQNFNFNEIHSMDLFQNIGDDLGKYEKEYEYKQKLEHEHFKKEQQKIDQSEKVKEDFKYKLDLKTDGKDYEEYMEDNLKKQYKNGGTQLDATNVDLLFAKYHI